MFRPFSSLKSYWAFPELSFHLFKFIEYHIYRFVMSYCSCKFEYILRNVVIAS